MKDPAFLFYTNDFLSGIQDLTFEERGQFITLLCLQHQKGHLSEKLIKLSVGNATADVMAKFRQDSSGLWYNVRLDLEIEKRQAHGEKQRKRAIDGWKNRKNNTNIKPNESRGITTVMPLENVNVNEDVIVKEKIKNMCEFFKFSEMSFPQQFFAASEFINCLVHRNMIEHFDKQFMAYKQLKIKEGFKHSFKKFIGTPELFYEDGAWNSENWESKAGPIQSFEIGKNNDDKYKNMVAELADKK